MRKLRGSCGVLFLLLIASATPAAAIPSDDLLNSLHATADVNDFAGLLTPAQEEALEAKCRQLRERTGAQLAVVTLKSLQGGEIGDFTNKLFARWGVGGEKQDNGLMLLVAVDERRSRIEVGYGLEPIIPDALAGRILDNDLRPHFRQGDYAGGLAAAVDKLSQLVEKGEPADQRVLAGESQVGLGEAIILVLFLSVFVAVGSFVFGLGLGTKHLQGLLVGGLFGGIPMLLGTATVGRGSLVVHVPLAIALGFLGWLASKNDKGWKKLKRSWTQSQPTTWNWGDYSGGGWTSGGGGFSQGWGGFGGGSSGGGGASGSW